MSVGIFPVPFSGIQETFVDAKGDILTASADNVPARLAIGANGTVLTAASGEATGLSWATPASGGMTSLASGAIAISATTLSLTSISGSYNTLELRISKASNSGGSITMQVNGDTASNYQYIWADSGNLTWQAASGTSIALLRLGYSGSSTNITFANYTSTTSSKIIEIRSASDGTARAGIAEGIWYNQAAAISSILVTFSPAIDSAGTYVLYGVK